jgi:hypothetical protein
VTETDRTTADLFLHEVYDKEIPEFTGQYLMPGSSQNKLWEAHTSKKNRAKLKALTLLRCAYARPAGDPVAQKALLEATTFLVPNPERRAKQVADDPLNFCSVRYSRELIGWVYAGELDRVIKQARITVSREFVPVIICPNITVAGFCFVAYRGAFVCLNCGNLFAVDFAHPDGSKGEIYCTQRCGQAYRQKTYRLKVKGRKK